MAAEAGATETTGKDAAARRITIKEALTAEKERLSLKLGVVERALQMIQVEPLVAEFYDTVDCMGLVRYR